MKLNALYLALHGIKELVHESGSDYDVYGEGFGKDERRMEHRVAV